MNNYISLNIKYLLDKEKLTQKEFGDIFGLKQNVISTYIKGSAIPKLETILKICTHFKISIDDFIVKDLRKSNYSSNSSYYNDPIIEHLSEEPSGSIKHGGLQELLESKDMIIKLLKQEVERLKEEKSGESGSSKAS